jgi:Fic family protein
MSRRSNGFISRAWIRRVFTLIPVAADVADAEASIHRLDAGAAALLEAEALARLLLRAVAVASSHIEGLEIGGRRLLRAEAAQRRKVLGNVETMSWAVTTLADAAAVTVAGVLEIHRRLLRGTRIEAQAGQIRTTQNWIGGSTYNPCSAAFVPPPPEDVPRLLDDLCAFCTADELPTIVQAAIAHAQFETIHPFSGGNGRTGRAPIHVTLRRRGLATRVLPPVSLVLAMRPNDYVRGLTATRISDPPAPRTRSPATTSGSACSRRRAHDRWATRLRSRSASGGSKLTGETDSDA